MNIQDRVFFVSAFRDGAEMGVMNACKELGYKTAGYTSKDNPIERKGIAKVDSYDEAIIKNIERATLTIFIAHMTDKEIAKARKDLKGHDVQFNLGTKDLCTYILHLLKTKEDNEKIIINIIGNTEEEVKYITQGAEGIYLVALNRLMETWMKR